MEKSIIWQPEQMQETDKMEYKISEKLTKEMIEAILDVKEEQGLTPESIVEAATDPESPLHNRFEWNDTEAARKWRLQQARVLINEVKIIVEEGTIYPAFENVSVVLQTSSNTQQIERQYLSREEILSEPELRSQIIKRALAQADYWQNLYGSYQELSPISKAINAVKDKYSKGVQ